MPDLIPENIMPPKKQLSVSVDEQRQILINRLKEIELFIPHSPDIARTLAHNPETDDPLDNADFRVLISKLWDPLLYVYIKSHESNSTLYEKCFEAVLEYCPHTLKTWILKHKDELQHNNLIWGILAISQYLEKKIKEKPFSAHLEIAFQLAHEGHKLRSEIALLKKMKQLRIIDTLEVSPILASLESDMKNQYSLALAQLEPLALHEKTAYSTELLFFSKLLHWRIVPENNSLPSAQSVLKQSPFLGAFNEQLYETRLALAESTNEDDMKLAFYTKLAHYKDNDFFVKDQEIIYRSLFTSYIKQPNKKPNDIHKACESYIGTHTFSGYNMTIYILSQCPAARKNLMTSPSFLWQRLLAEYRKNDSRDTHILDILKEKRLNSEVRFIERSDEEIQLLCGAELADDPYNQATFRQLARSRFNTPHDDMEKRFDILQEAQIYNFISGETDALFTAEIALAQAQLYHQILLKEIQHYQSALENGKILARLTQYWGKSKFAFQISEDEDFKPRMLYKLQQINEKCAAVLNAASGNSDLASTANQCFSASLSIVATFLPEEKNNLEKRYKQQAESTLIVEPVQISSDTTYEQMNQALEELPEEITFANKRKLEEDGLTDKIHKHVPVLLRILEYLKENIIHDTDSSQKSTWQEILIRLYTHYQHYYEAIGDFSETWAFITLQIGAMCEKNKKNLLAQKAYQDILKYYPENTEALSCLSALNPIQPQQPTPLATTADNHDLQTVLTEINRIYEYYCTKSIYLQIEEFALKSSWNIIPTSYKIKLLDNIHGEIPSIAKNITDHIIALESEQKISSDDAFILSAFTKIVAGNDQKTASGKEIFKKLLAQKHSPWLQKWHYLTIWEFFFANTWKAEELSSFYRKLHELSYNADEGEKIETVYAHFTSQTQSIQHYQQAAGYCFNIAPEEDITRDSRVLRYQNILIGKETTNQPSDAILASLQLIMKTPLLHRSLLDDTFVIQTLLGKLRNTRYNHDTFHYVRRCFSEEAANFLLTTKEKIERLLLENNDVIQEQIKRYQDCGNNLEKLGEISAKDIEYLQSRHKIEPYNYSLLYQLGIAYCQKYTCLIIEDIANSRLLLSHYAIIQSFFSIFEQLSSEIFKACTDVCSLYTIAVLLNRFENATTEQSKKQVFVDLRISLPSPDDWISSNAHQINYLSQLLIKITDILPEEKNALSHNYCIKLFKKCEEYYQNTEPDNPILSTIRAHMALVFQKNGQCFLARKYYVLAPEESLSKENLPKVTEELNSLISARQHNSAIVSAQPAITHLTKEKNEISPCAL